LDVFKLFGTIAINNAGANKAISETSGLAEGLSKTFSKVGSAVMKVGAVAGAGFTAAAAGASMLMKKSIAGYAEYEQVMEGSKLLFGEGYDYIAEKAASSFKNVQMSQSEYYKSVNGYATGLKKSLKGSELEAAVLADRIISAQADIVAATGKDQESIANAFSGVMRGEFSMLDNLGLGITATKSGFAQLIKEVNKYNKAHGKATKYTINNQADCYNALLDYVEMQGLAGYAAMESAETIAGSWESTKASFSDMVTGMADGTQDMDTLVSNFA
jgi:hypothetical protein